MNKNPLNIITVGNPNSGKTSLFNALTGSKQHVGNWPGVTVDKKTGYYTQKVAQQIEQTVAVTDLPGFYSLESSSEQRSLDRSIAVQEILNTDQHDQTDQKLIINIVDATNLERHLYLTTQLRELQRPMVVVINKIDLLEKQHQSLDLEKLQKALGCPVYALSAHRKDQVAVFKSWIFEQYQQGVENNSFHLNYGETIEIALSSLTNIRQTNEQVLSDEIAKPLLRNQLLNFLAGNTSASLLTNYGFRSERQQEQATKIRNQLASQIDIDIEIADTRYTFLHQLCQKVRKHKGPIHFKLTEALDNILLHRIWGIPCFLFIMYLMFMFSINIGGAFIDFFDISFGALLVDGGHYLFDPLLPAWLVTLLVDGVGVGIQTVTTFIPVIFFLYLFMSLLESTGYMARAAFILDKLMQKIGLPGKAFVPLIIGFGCNVPSVMATRTLDQENERRLAAAMVPFMSCGARLPVYALFCTAFFPKHAQDIVFILYLLGVFVALFTGLLLSRTIFPVNSTGMVIEMPNYERPTLAYLWFKTYHKLKRFIFGAGKTIVIAITILSFLNSLGTDGSFGNQNNEKSVLTYTAKIVTPILEPIGLTKENWPATIGIITGLFAKEAVVGTLNTLYSQNNQINNTQHYDLLASLKEALISIPNNLSALSFTDPLKISVDTSTDLEKVAEEQSVDQSIFGNIQATFVSQSAAMAYLIFILLYTPCVAAIGAYVREFGRSFMFFIAGWTTLMAYTCATLFYQISHFNDHPLNSSLWIAFFIVLISMITLWLKYNRQRFALPINFKPSASKNSCCS